MQKHLRYLLGALAVIVLIIIGSGEWLDKPVSPGKITQVTPPEHCNLCEFKEYPK